MTDSSSRQSVTGLLLQWRDGRKEALDRLVPIVYSELKGLARTRLRGEQEGHSLQATALVHVVDLRVSKAFALGAAGRAELLMDLLNLFNDTAEEGLATDNFFSPTFGQPTVFMYPRRAMVGVRLNLGR